MSGILSIKEKINGLAGRNKGKNSGEPVSVERKSGKKKKGKNKKLKRIIIIVLVFTAAFAAYSSVKKSQAKEEETAVDPKNLGRAEKGDITKELTSSGSLEAKDTYEITSLVEGEIIEADFEEGDMVEKDQVLYRIDPTDMQRKLESADRSLETAKKDLEEAQADYKELQSEFAGNIYRAKTTGYVKNITVVSGDSVGGQNGTEIADLYNDTVMEVRIPFLTGEANALSVGTQVILTIADTGEEIPGQITSIANLEEALTGGTLVKYATIQAANPGGLSTSDTATARAGDIYSAGDGAFEPYIEEKLKCDLSESAKVEAVLVKEGQFIQPGTPLFSLTADSVEDALKTAKDKEESAQAAYDNAVDQYDEQQDSLEDYTITAPISGTVITKNSKAGDKISRSGNSDTTMAIIYDLSELTFEMSIDELDISEVETGQEVKITADAFDDRTYSGYVTNVSMNGSYSNGVSTYPVTVTLEEDEGLIPGMNVDGTIILDEVKDTLRVPSGALQRGNIVYVQNESIEADREAGKTVGISESGDRQSAGEEGSQGENSQPSGDGNSEKPGTAQPASIAGAPAGFTAVRVETGLISDDYVEITVGLNEGDVVYVKETESSGGMMMFGIPGGGPGGRPGGGGGPGGRR